MSQVGSVGLGLREVVQDHRRVHKGEAGHSRPSHMHVLDESVHGGPDPADAVLDVEGVGIGWLPSKLDSSLLFQATSFLRIQRP